MDTSRVFAVLASIITEVLPGVDPTMISASARLTDLGVSSVNRAEIIAEAMDTCGVRVPMVEFGGRMRVGEIADVLHSHSVAA